MFEQISPDLLERKTGGGCLALFGLPFFLAGLFVMLIPLGIVPVENEDELPRWALIFLPLFGLPFVAVGLGLMLGRRGLILDRSRNSLMEWWGLLTPMKRKEYLLDQFDRVLVYRQEGDKDSPTTFPVELKSKDNQASISIDQPADYQQSRKLSEQLSRFLKVSLEDSVSGQKVVREYEHLDESLAERGRRTKEEIVVPAQPLTLRSKIEQSGDQLVIEIPGPGINHLILAASLVPMLIAGYIMYRVSDFIQNLPRGFEIRSGIIGLALLIGLIWGLRFLGRRKKEKTCIIASRQELRVERYSYAGVKTEVIPGSELEELHLPTPQGIFDSALRDLPGADQSASAGNSGVLRMPDGRPIPGWMLILGKLVKSPGITAQSDKAMVQFGGGLSEDELSYLCALIKKAMIG